MSEVRNVGNFQFYSVNRIVKNGFHTPELPVYERTDTICNVYEFDRAVLAQKDHEIADALRSHIVLYSPLGIIVPTDRNLTLTRSRGAQLGFNFLTESVAYGQLKDVTPEVNEELNLVDLERLGDLERLVRSRYSAAVPEGWCTVFIGNRIVPN